MAGREEQVREDSLRREDENWTWKDPAAGPVWTKAAGGNMEGADYREHPAVAGAIRRHPPAGLRFPPLPWGHSGASSLSGSSVGVRSRTRSP